MVIFSRTATAGQKYARYGSCSFRDQLLPASLLCPVRGLLFVFHLSFCNLLGLPSLHVICFLCLLFPLARLRCSHLFCSVLFLVLLPLPALPHLSPPSFTSQWWPLAKAALELSVRALQLLQAILQPQAPFLPETVGSKPSVAPTSLS